MRFELNKPLTLRLTFGGVAIFGVFCLLVLRVWATLGVWAWVVARGDLWEFAGGKSLWKVLCGC